MTFQMLIKTELLKISLFCFKHSDVVFILLINVKMSTIVCILAFMGRINSMLNRVEDETAFIT